METTALITRNVAINYEAWTNVERLALDICSECGDALRVDRFAGRVNNDSYCMECRIAAFWAEEEEYAATLSAKIWGAAR